MSIMQDKIQVKSVKLNERYDEWQSLYEGYNLWKQAAKRYASEKGQELLIQVITSTTQFYFPLAACEPAHNDVCGPCHTNVGCPFLNPSGMIIRLCSMILSSIFVNNALQLVFQETIYGRVLNNIVQMI